MATIIPSNSQYDVLIIGAGPIGLACAIEAKNAGLSYIIVEKGPLVNSLYHYPVFMTFFSTSQKLEIGGVPFVSISNKPNRNEALEYYRRVAEKFHLNINFFTAINTFNKNFIVGIFGKFKQLLFYLLHQFARWCQNKCSGIAFRQWPAFF